MRVEFGVSEAGLKQSCAIWASGVSQRGEFSAGQFRTQGPRLFHRLEREGILLRERTKDLGPGFVRITIGTQAEMELLLKKMKRLGFSADTRR